MAGSCGATSTIFNSATEFRPIAHCCLVGPEQEIPSLVCRSMARLARKKTAAERREQSFRVEGRHIQVVVRQLQQIYLHRGSQLSRIGVALLAALSTPVLVVAVQTPQARSSFVPPPPPPPPPRLVVPDTQLNPDAPACVPEASQPGQPCSGGLGGSDVVASSSAVSACGEGGVFIVSVSVFCCDK